MTAPDDVILDRIPEGVDPRKNIGMGVKIAVLLRMLNLRADDVQWDHRPPLWSRKWNATTQDTVPPASDPEFIIALSVKAHDTVTNGRGGERRITSAGSDTHARAQADRLNERTAEFRRVILAKATGEELPAPTGKPKRTIKARPNGGWPARGTRGFPSRKFSQQDHRR